MKLPKAKVFINHLGVDPNDYRTTSLDKKQRNIGYISRMCEANGFDIIIDAFVELKKEDEFDDVKLILTGGSTGADKQILKKVEEQLKKENLWQDVEFHEDFDGAGRHDFFQKVQMISVPVRNGEAFGLYLLESMASGVPVVQPKLGAFPEIIEISNGGVVYENNTVSELATALKDLLKNQDQIRLLTESCRKGVEEKFNITYQSENLLNIYQELSKQ